MYPASREWTAIAASQHLIKDLANHVNSASFFYPASAPTEINRHDQHTAQAGS
jgi:hypothetical protein